MGAVERSLGQRMVRQARLGDRQQAQCRETPGVKQLQVSRRREAGVSPFRMPVTFLDDMEPMRARTGNSVEWGKKHRHPGLKLQ